MHQDLKWFEELFSDIFGEPIHFCEVYAQNNTKPKEEPKEKEQEFNKWKHEDFLFTYDDPEEIREPRQVNWETLITPERVIFNQPATIVWWSDGSKTVVKCHEDDTYDKEKGLAMAFMKRMYGIDGYFNEIVKEWCPYER